MGPSSSATMILIMQDRRERISISCTILVLRHDWKYIYVHISEKKISMTRFNFKMMKFNECAFNPVVVNHSVLRSQWSRNIGYQYKNHLKPKSHEISFAHKLFLSIVVLLKFFTKHGSFTAVLCVKFRNDWTIEINIMMKGILLHLSLRWGSDGYLILFWQSLDNVNCWC